MIKVNIKPIIAARPFKRSAYSLKPNFGSSSWGVVVGWGCVIVLKLCDPVQLHLFTNVNCSSMIKHCEVLMNLIDDHLYRRCNQGADFFDH